MTASRPLLSVIVGLSSDTNTEVARADHLAGCLEALAGQVDAPPMEIIVPHQEPVEGLADVKERFPEVRFLSSPDVRKRAGDREHHDVLRARGIAASSGDVVGMLEDHERPDRHWAANVLTAHRKPHAVVGGAIENAVDRGLNWAVYYCDFGRYQNPVPEGPTPFASDANVTYKRAALERVRSAWEDAYREVPLHEAIKALNESIVLDPNIIVHQNRRGLTLGEAMRERFSWGRSYAATRVGLVTRSRRFAYAALAPVLPAVLIARIGRTAWNRKRHFRKFVRAVPFLIPLLMSWSAGEMAGYLAPSRVGR